MILSRILEAGAQGMGAAVHLQEAGAQGMGAAVHLQEAGAQGMEAAGHLQEADIPAILTDKMIDLGFQCLGQQLSGSLT
jgi:hypothetical protein